METINIIDCNGYLWWSNQESPEIFEGEDKAITLDEKSNPFIIEGQLFGTIVNEQEGPRRNVSCSIKYVDGKYLVYKNDIDSALLDLDEGKQKSITLKDEEREDVPCIVERKDYLSNRMDGKWLKFLRYWEAKPDENCEGMSAFAITKNVFIGFKK